MATHETGIAAAAAAPVEDELTRKIGGRDARLDLKRGLVLLVTRHIVTVPLPAKALCITVAGKPGYPADDGIVHSA